MIILQWLYVYSMMYSKTIVLQMSGLNSASCTLNLKVSAASVIFQVNVIAW